MYALRLSNGIRHSLATIEDIKYYMKTYVDQIKCPEYFRSNVEKVPALEHNEDNPLERALMIKDLMKRRLEEKNTYYFSWNTNQEAP